MHPPTRPASDKPFAPACERNKEVILAVLQTHFADRRHVLEIGSGTGQHAVHFAAAMPWLRWQCADRHENLAGIRMWLDDAGLPNTPAPVPLQAVAAGDGDPGGLQPLPALPVHGDGRHGFDAVFAANTLHIMSWDEVRSMFTALPALLTMDAVVAVYGPFNRHGGCTSDGNREFDASLRARDPRSGLRDEEAVEALAASIGLVPVDAIAMPANNRMLMWRRAANMQGVR
jgi:Protein of unknown function (DUF938)